MNKFSTLVTYLYCTVFLFACQSENTVLLKQETVDITISASGELESKQRVFIAPPTVQHMWQYNIKTMLPENTKVTKGQLLVSFDDKQIRDRLTDKKGKLAQAKKILENKSREEIATEQELILTVSEKQMEFEKAKRKADIIDHSRSSIDRKKAAINFTIASNDLDLAKKMLNIHQDNTLLN